MDSARWEQIQGVFNNALERPESERQTFLEAACGRDLELMSEVLTMLNADSRGAAFLDRGLPDVASQILGAPFQLFSLREFGPYRLKRILGEGGMGVVWLGEREDTGNLVAIKFLPHAGLSPARRERFTREIKTLAKLKHRFIARLYDAGTLADGTPWFVMEYVEGAHFTEYCRAHDQSIEERLRLFRMVCEAVQYAHGQEIIHRDLKPSNILVEGDGTPRLLDFGIARELHNLDEPADQTRPGLRFLSPDYAAPEWLLDGMVGFYTDVYSLGVILYEMLTGQLPAKNNVEKPSAAGKRMRPLTTAAWNDLDVLCLKAMNRDPQQRYQSVEALIRDIDHYLKHEPLEARPDTLPYRLGKFLRRNRRAVLAASLMLALVAGLVVFFTLRLAKERNTAVAEAARTRRIQRFMRDLLKGGDEEFGASKDLRVATVLDHGVEKAHALDRDPLAQAELYSTLADSYDDLGDFQKADSILHLALKERTSVLGPNSKEVAETLLGLGLLRMDQAQYAEAERLIRKGLAIDEQQLPANDPMVAKYRSALGLALMNRGAYNSAIEQFNESLRIQTGRPELISDLGDNLTDLATAHFYLGHYAESESFDRRVLALDRQLHPGDHASLAMELVNLGNVEQELTHYAEAERDFRQALAIDQSWYGKDNPETANLMRTLAQTLVFENRCEEAAQLVQQALIVQERAYGKAHPRVAMALGVLGKVALKRGSLDEARADFTRALEIYRAAYGDKHYYNAVALSDLADTYLQEKDYARAEQFYREALDRLSGSLPPDHPRTARAQMALGEAILLQHRNQDAEAHLLAGYRILLKQTIPPAAWIQKARQDLATLYAGWNQPEKAAKFRAELASNELTSKN